MLCDIWEAREFLGLCLTVGNRQASWWYIFLFSSLYVLGFQLGSYNGAMLIVMQYSVS